jgi:DoxX-like family
MRFNKTLWVVQGLLAALFLFAGISKLVMPIEAMAGPIALPGGFLRFIGVAETLGALGLILPMAFRIRPGLTPVAAAGLTIVMIGATVLSAAAMGAASAVFPGVVGVLTTVVSQGRRSLVGGQSAAGSAARHVVSA